MPKAKNEEAGSLSKSEKAKLQRLYREGKAAYRSVQNLQKAIGCQRRRLLIFYTERILILNLDKQFDISKDYLLLQNVSMRFGVLIWLLWMNCLNLITV